MSINKLMDNETVVNQHNGILLSIKMNELSVHNIDESKIIMLNERRQRSIYYTKSFVLNSKTSKLI